MIEELVAWAAEHKGVSWEKAPQETAVEVHSALLEKTLLAPSLSSQDDEASSASSPPSRALKILPDSREIKVLEGREGNQFALVEKFNLITAEKIEVATDI